MAQISGGTDKYLSGNYRHPRFFSLLQHALNPVAQRITITGPIKDKLKYLLWLAQDVKNRPTHIGDIIPTPTTYYGAADAAKPVMGGVLLSPENPESLAFWTSVDCRLQEPCLWRQPFEPKIQAQIISESNPEGNITNIDLELSGTIAQEEFFSNSTSVPHLTTCYFTNNTPAIDWSGKGSTNTNGPDAYLLHISALHQRHYFHKPDTHFIPGSRNLIANCFSCKLNLTDY